MMNRGIFGLIVGVLALLFCCGGEIEKERKMIKLPSPVLKGTMSVEEAIYKRRSVRRYGERALNINELSQLLFAAYGITDTLRGFRSAPSAGATYPMEIYVVVGDVVGLEKGLYHYIPEEHTIELVRKGDLREELAKAALNQGMILKAPISIVIASENRRTTSVYGERGIRYIHMEVGHIGQNIYLECEALGLGTVAIGAFFDDRVKNVLGIKEEPLYIMPVGAKPK